MSLRSALAAILLVLLAGCADPWVDDSARQHARTGGTPQPVTTSVPPDGPTPDAAVTYDTVPCPMALPSDQAERVECGELDVPVDRRNPDEARVRVAVAVIASSDPQPEPDPVLYLHGGPGGLALADTIEWVFPPHPLLADRDVILVDQRGSGWSTPSLNCPAAEAAAAEVTALVTCRRDLEDQGVDLEHFTSSDIAQDLIDLRRSLAIDSWNLYGVSYGSRVALTLMDTDAGGVRAAILDSPYPPEVMAYVEQTPNASAAIDAVLVSCADDARCGAAFGDLREPLDQLLRSLDEQAEPTEFDEPDQPRLVVDDAVLASALFSALYDRFTIPDIPRAVQLAVDGDLASSLELLGAADGFARPRQNEDAEYDSLADAELAFWASECREEVATASETSVLDAIDIDDALQAALVEEALDALRVCDRLDIGADAEAEQGPIASDIATLVLVGEFDPITPPSWARQAAASLSAVEVIEVVGSGHAPSFEQCPLDVLVAFVADPTPPIDAACVADLEPLPFSVE